MKEYAAIPNSRGDLELFDAGNGGRLASLGNFGKILNVTNTGTKAFVTYQRGNTSVVSRVVIELPFGGSRPF